MSKKNRKNRHIVHKSDNTREKEGIVKPEKLEAVEKNEDTRKDFLNLIISMGFVVAILLFIYYLDQRDNILEHYAQQIFNTF